MSPLRQQTTFLLALLVLLCAACGVEEQPGNKPLQTLRQKFPEPGSSCLSVVPELLDFGEAICTSVRKELRLHHANKEGCPASIRLTDVTLHQEAKGSFRILKGPMFPLVLEKGQFATMELAYKPQQTKSARGALVISFEGPHPTALSVSLTGTKGITPPQTETFRKSSRLKADLLFVIDDSPTMANYQTNLKENFTALINWIVRLNIDYHVMVVSADTSGQRFPAGCARGQETYVMPQTPNVLLRLFQNTQLGSGGHPKAQPLEAAYQALQPKALEGCNRGFLRPDASLSIIIVSASPDQSPRTTDQYKSFFKLFKGPRASEKIRLSTVSGPPPRGCPFQPSAVLPAPRLWEVSKQLNGLQEQICSKFWARTMSSYARILLGYRTSFFLKQHAEPDSISVRVDRRLLRRDRQDGWTYEPKNHSVYLAKSQTPGPGALIQVTYRPACLP